MRRAIAGDLAPRAHTTLLAKDSRLALEMAAAAGFDGAAREGGRERFRAACAAGFGALDDASLLQLLRDGGGLAAGERGEARQVDVAAADDHADPLAGAARPPCARAAAKPRQPVGSTIIFMRSAKKRIASTSCASLAVSTSSTSRRMISKVMLAQVLGLRAVGDRLRRVDVHDRGRCATTAGRRCRPRARRRRSCSAGDSARAASAEPESRPPPPRQTNSASSGADLLEQLLGRRALAGDHVRDGRRAGSASGRARRPGAGRSPRGPRV